jgi:hypothetical protein
MDQVLFITVKVSTNYPWLDEKMLQITQAGQSQISLGKHPCVTVSSYEEINEYKNSARWLFVQTAGDMILNRDHLWSKLETITDDIGIMGHIIWYPEYDIPHLHEQCFIINTEAFKDQYLTFKEEESIGPTFIRGEGDMNCGHAPLSVSLSNEIRSRKLEFGSSMMLHALSKGYRVVNFNKEWRYPEDNQDKLISIEDLVEELDLDPERFKLASRGYFYPRVGSELLDRALKALSPLDGLEESQYLIIRILRKMLDYKYLNVWQWDIHMPHIQAETVISPANGLLGESMALTSGAQKIIFYDINPNNIEFKIKLYKEWDGKNYQAFANNFAKERNLTIEPYIDSAKLLSLELERNNQQIFNNWHKLKSLDIEFYNVDLISDGKSFIQNEKNCYIHTSTILGNYIITQILHDKPAIENFRNFLKEHTQTTNSHWMESV